jgi:hypothetical protein
VAHAGLKQAYHGRPSARVLSFALYGEPSATQRSEGLSVPAPGRAELRMLRGRQLQASARYVRQCRILAGVWRTHGLTGRSTRPASGVR